MKSFIRNNDFFQEKLAEQKEKDFLYLNINANNSLFMKELFKRIKEANGIKKNNAEEWQEILQVKE